MDSILYVSLDRIYRIFRNSLERFPDENAQIQSPSAYSINHQRFSLGFIAKIIANTRKTSLVTFR